MLLRSLELENFRLVREVTLELRPGVNLFIGGNAQGKTTLLEAAAYLASGRSFRTPRDRDVLPHQAADQGIAAAIASGQTEAFGSRHRLRALITAQNKTLEVDGKNLTRLADLWGLFHAVVFIPSDLELVRGAPGERRGLLDALLTRTSRYDLAALQAYAQALRQRNAALRTGVASGTQLEAYEQVMAEHGARVLAAREALIRDLAPPAEQHLHHLAGGQDKLRLVHDPGVGASTGVRNLLAQEAPDLEAIAGRLRDYWENHRDADAQRGFTFGGPHRGDLVLELNGRDARAFASQGQTRSLVLALRLAEVDLLTARTRERPVLLLDDVFGELDRRRLEHFLALLNQPGQQALVTATDAHDVEGGLEVAARWTVEAGAAREA